MRPMTGLRVLSIALVVVGCSSGMRSASSSPVTPDPTDVAAIRAVFDTTAFGWNHGDLSAYLYAYAPSATAIGRTGLVHGPSGIEEQMRAGFWKTGRPTQSPLRSPGNQSARDGITRSQPGQYILTGGGQPDRTGWFSTIWERTPAGWRMIHDHS